MKNMSVVADLKSQGWVNIVGFENYLTDGINVISFGRNGDGSELCWVQATRGEQVVLYRNGRGRGVTRSALSKAFSDGGILPPSRTKTPQTKKTGVSKYTYLSGGIECSIQHIVTTSGLSYWTVHGRLKEYGGFEHLGVRYERRG